MPQCAQGRWHVAASARGKARHGKNKQGSLVQCVRAVVCVQQCAYSACAHKNVVKGEVWQNVTPQMQRQQQRNRGAKCPEDNESIRSNRTEENDKRRSRTDPTGHSERDRTTDDIPPRARARAYAQASCARTRAARWIGIST